MLIIAVLAAAVLVVLAAAGARTAAAATPAARAAAPCRAPEVAVVVDFGHWGGSAHRGCVAFSGGLTGLGVLERAGFAVTGTANYGTAFVCRINGYPRPAADRCIDTPPATAYWAYWHADQGQSTWTYGNVGASLYRPAPGSVDAWTFGGTDAGGAGGRPAFSPAQVRPAPGVATSPSHSPPTGAATPTATHTRPPSPTAPSGPTRSSPPRSTPPRSTPSESTPSATRSGPPTHPPATTRRSTSRSSSATAAQNPNPSTGGRDTAPGAPVGSGRSASAGGSTPDPSSAATERVVDDPTAVRAAAPGAGSPWPTVAGIGVCAVLAAGGGTVAVRRRKSRGGSRR